MFILDDLLLGAVVVCFIIIISVLSSSVLCFIGLLAGCSATAKLTNQIVKSSYYGGNDSASKQTKYISELYNYKKWRDPLMNMIFHTIEKLKVDIKLVEKIIFDNVKANNTDSKIINVLASLDYAPNKSYSTSDNFAKATFRYETIITPYINYKITGIMDYGGGNGDMAYKIGREISRLDKKNVLVVDINDFGGFEYTPRNDITFIHFDDIDTIKTKVNLITIYHTLHHIESKHYPKIIELFNRVLTDDGIIVLYEHDCINENRAHIIDIEHILYDCVISKKATYDEYIEKNYTKYLSVDGWKDVFSKYFESVGELYLHNIDYSFYMFLKRKGGKPNIKRIVPTNKIRQSIRRNKSKQRKMAYLK
jgi:ubiquinone/menaquinone biosynthesis C-methylase UbiE